MIRFVKNGQIVMTEADNGELQFFDEELAESFKSSLTEDGSEAAGESEAQIEKLTRAHERLHALFATAETDELRQQIRRVHERAVAQMASAGISHTAVDALDE